MNPLGRSGSPWDSSARREKATWIDRVLVFVWVVGYAVVLAVFRVVRKLES